MSKGDGGDSFGFAPYGRLGQQNRDRPVHPKVNEESYGAEQPVAHAPSPRWAWLLMGFLMGSGGTLIASSFWLQGSYVTPSIAMNAEPAAAGQFENSEKVAPATKSAENAPDDVPAGDNEQVAALASDDSKGETGAGTDRPAVSGRDTAKPTSETAISSREEKARPIPNGEALLVSDNRAEPANLPQTREGETGDEVVATDEADRRRDDKTITVATVDPIEHAASMPEATNGRHYQRNIDRTTTTAAARASASDRSDSTPIAAATDQSREVQSSGNAASTEIQAVTPRPSSSENVNSGIRLRGVTETANANATVGERTARAEPDGNRQPSKRIYRVQLAAVDGEKDAEIYWREAKTRLPAVLDGVEPIFDRREVDQRIFFRVWIGAFDKRTEADNYCGWLKSKGQDCFVTRG